MAKFTFHKASITGIASSFPKNIVLNSGLSSTLTTAEEKKITDSTGIKERRFASNKTTASDLCVEAAYSLLHETNTVKEDIDVLIFLSQTPDYLGVPATACSIQNRLGLPKTVAAFDMVLGCSGFVYALSNAFSYVESGAKKVLLLVGETMSKFTSLDDKSTGLIFGDGASAILIERDESADISHFELFTDGSGFDAIQIPEGGYRTPFNKDSLEARLQDDGSIRSGVNVYMDGLRVFDFTMKNVTKSIKSLLKENNINKDDVDYFFLHQANKFMIDLFAKKLKVTEDKVPISIHKYGNTSAVSIPLTITHHIFECENKTPQLSLFCGFGSGLSWGTALVNLSSCKCYLHGQYKEV